MHLNEQGQCEALIQHFESGRVAFTQDNLGEYIKALARLDRLDNSRLLNIIQVQIRKAGFSVENSKHLEVSCSLSLYFGNINKCRPSLKNVSLQSCMLR
jgi:hypothetical protein